MKSSTDHPPQSGKHSFLQDSTLLTALPPEQQNKAPQIVPSAADQKIVSLVRPVLAQLDSRGSIQINITVPASALTLGKLLGEGAYGSVYEGLWNDQAVAIKRLKAQHLTEKGIEELRQEAQIMFQLGVESKYIVPLKKICLEAPHYSLVMELMPKGSLYQLLHNGQDLPWSIRFRIAMDTVWGLKDLHAYSILHRDLKSLNILLDDRLRAKLADFGLAKVKQETSSQSSIAKGTVLWMAPELFKRRAEVTAAADIWSFGMVLWELITREIPFKDAQNQLQAMGWIKDGEKEEIPGDCPPTLKAIIESCWDLAPAKRPTAIQVAERLKPLVTTPEQKQPSTPSILNPKEDQRELEMQKLKAEIERIKRQHETELKHAKDLKFETTVQPPKSTPPLPSLSQTIPQTSYEQLALQNQLIVACKRGDEKAVTALFKRGAKPNITNIGGEHPLGAAVWGMCPDVVNALLKQAGGGGFFDAPVAPMTWEECEKHNLKYYKEVFIIPKFDPRTSDEWYQLLLKIDPNPFIRALHLRKVNDECDNYYGNFDELKYYVKVAVVEGRGHGRIWIERGDLTEAGYVGYRAKIKRSVESAKQPIQPSKSTPSLLPVSQTIAQTILPPPKPKASAEQLKLQDQLIAACKQGDKKAVKSLLQKGAKPDIANAKGEQPLGAAVWGMCPDVVNALLKEAKGIAPMTWEECEKHNQKFYQEVFIVPIFDPRSYGEWDRLLQKIDPNPFVRAYHLKKLKERWHHSNSSSWNNLKKYVSTKNSVYGYYSPAGGEIVSSRLATEQGFLDFRSQIQQGVETAKQPTVALHF